MFERCSRWQHGTMIQHIVPVSENRQLAERTYLLGVEDAQIAAAILPGQFVMLRSPGITDPLLGRPFALYDTYLDSAGRASGYSIVHLVVGKMTGLMSRLSPGDQVEVWGPLGNGFEITPTEHLLMVAGGIGQTPFLAVARAYLGKRRYGLAKDVQRAGHEDRTIPRARQTRKLSLCYGVRTAALLAGVDDFRALGVDVAMASDDGSAGHHGYVTDLVVRALDAPERPTRIIGCGPEPMMALLARLASEAGVPCELSLETPMACGVGACFSCVAKIRQDNGQWDYRRVCVDGPVFDAKQVVF